MRENLVLLGMMGVGKTTLGRLIAKEQNLEFIDIDSNIEKENEMSITEIFKTKGESLFRKLEEKEVLKSLEKEKCVISLGGGAFINKKVRDKILQNAVSIWLDMNVDTLNQRVKRSKKRPLLGGENSLTKLKALYLYRKFFYKLADHKIVCDRLSKNEVVKKIIQIYEKY